MGVSMGDVTPMRTAPRFKASLWMILGAALLMSMTGLVVSTVAIVRQAVPTTKPYDPLGEFTVQKITNPLPPGAVSPTVNVGDTVGVEGLKCNASNEIVAVRGGFHWSRIDPGAFYTPYVMGQNRMLPGCTRQSFLNAMPAEVIANVTDMCRHAHRCQTAWRLDGFVIPVDPHGHEGSQRLWFTGNFIIVAR